jgi:hypothetical protein
MQEYKVGQILAERSLRIEGDPDVRTRVVMGAPQQHSENGHDYVVCPIQIVGLGDENIRAARGVDAFQAMQLGMQLIGTELYVKLNRICDGKLRWEDEADLAFPLPESVPEFGPGHFKKDP